MCIDIPVKTFTRFHLKVNISKTETQIINQKDEKPKRPYPTTIINIDDNHINNVDTFKYLGAKINSSEAGTGWTEINFRINSAKAQFAQRKNLFTNFNISLIKVCY